MIKNKTIVGAMLVSRNPSILDMTIPSLLKLCDWIVIIMDNESKEVEEKVNEYHKNNYNKIWIRRSSVPSKLYSRKGKELNYHERWKSVKGIVRNDVFTILKTILALEQDGFNKIDILLWPDSDVIFTDSINGLLEKFIDSDYKAISMKHVDVLGSMREIRNASIGHHVHIMKFSNELSGLPRRFFAQYHPLYSNDIMKVENYSVHLAYFNNEIRGWRKDNWKNENLSCKCCVINKDIREMTPEEINNVLNKS